MKHVHFWTRIAALAMILALCLSLTAGNAVAENAARKVVIGESTDPETLSPYAALYADRYALLCMLYQPLVLTVGNTQYNVMITGYDEVAAGVYDVHLYENIYDTAGQHFTANDVAFCYGKAKESGNFSKLDAVKEVKALDDYTAEFTFDDTMMFGQIKTVLSQIFMVTEASFAASGDDMAVNAVGTTGYAVSSFVEGSSILFEKAANGYWQTAAEGEDGYVAYYDATKLDAVEYDFISDTAQMAMAVESGTIDVADRISAIDASLYAGKDGLTVYDTVGEAYTMTYNCSADSPMQSENLRKAIAYCWDGAGVLEGAVDGAGEAMTSLNTRYRLDYNADVMDQWDYYAYNPDKANEYLAAYMAEAGVAAPADIKLTVLVTNNTYLEKAAQMVQMYVMQLGVSCEVASYDNVTRKSIRNSTTGWDMAIAKDTAVNLYCVDGFAMQYNRDTGKSKAGGWVDSDELQQLLLAAIAPETHSVDTVTAFEQCMYDHAYCIGMIIDKVYSASGSWVDVVTGPYDVVSACASAYNWSEK